MKRVPWGVYGVVSRVHKANCNGCGNDRTILAFFVFRSKSQSYGCGFRPKPFKQLRTSVFVSQVERFPQPKPHTKVWTIKINCFLYTNRHFLAPAVRDTISYYSSAVPLSYVNTTLFQMLSSYTSLPTYHTIESIYRTSDDHTPLHRVQLTTYRSPVTPTTFLIKIIDLFS